MEQLHFASYNCPSYKYVVVLEPNSCSLENTWIKLNVEVYILLILSSCITSASPSQQGNVICLVSEQGNLIGLVSYKNVCTK